MVHLYYGYGKGKTTAAIGLAVRAAGAGKKVLCFQFLKGNNSAERKIIDSLMDVIPGRDGEKFIFQMNDEEKRKSAEYYGKRLDEIFEIAENYDLIVLDEALDAVEVGFISEKKLIELINKFGNCKEIIITGHNPSENIIGSCDYVTEMKKIKHPYDSGTKARRGIEY